MTNLRDVTVTAGCLLVAATLAASVLLEAAPIASPEATAPGAPPERVVSPDEPAPADGGPARILTSREMALRAERLLDEPEKAQVDAAVTLLESARAMDPTDGVVLAGLARATAIRFLRRWDADDARIDQAVDLARKAVIGSPDDARAHAALALASMIAADRAAEFDEADRAWGLKADSSPPWVHEAYAQTLIARGDAPEALRVLAELRNGVPARYQTYQMEGLAQLDLGHLEEALLAFRRANLLAPTFPGALLQIALVCDRMGRRDYAAQIYRQVGDQFPEQGPAILVRMAASLISRGKYSEAQAGLARAEFKTRRGLGQGTVVYLKALCADRMGRAAEAAALYRSVTSDFPDASYGGVTSESLASSAYEALARLELKAGRQNEAVGLMEQALGLPRPGLSLFTGLAAVYSEYGLPADAAEVLRRGALVDFGPRSAGTKAGLYVHWARAAKAVADGGKSAAMVMPALERDAAAIRRHGDVASFLEAARACAISGERSRALEWLRQAVAQGYSKLDWIGSDPEMGSLTAEKEFAELRGSAPSP
ncbi:MAG: hypothetical protein HY049_05585 [Acidobacteria bacterium]|nr:hypothetical protein [Acidobacteriota bacterium]